MNNKLLALVKYELKKNFLYNRNWMNNLLFLLLNMAIVPLTISPDIELLHQLFLPTAMTSMLLGVVLISNNIFDEDIIDGTFDQYQAFGLPMFVIYLSKVIITILEFIVIISIALICASLFYIIDFYLMLKIWSVILFSAPLLVSISIFGALLTINLNNNTAVVILLVFPLLISVLIILSLALNAVLTTDSFLAASSYIEINFGITILSIPILCILVTYLK
jgi:heme exporter protein B